MTTARIGKIITFVSVLLVTALMLNGCGAGKDASAGLVAKCIDEGGNPVEGASVVFCTDKTCQTVVSDGKGEASFDGGTGNVEVHVLAAPAGYTVLTKETKKTAAKTEELIFVFSKGEKTAAKENVQETSSGTKKTSEGIWIYNEEWDPALFTGQSYERTNKDLTDKFVPGREPVRFSTVDMNGNPVDESVFKKADVTMINFFEDWCVWCVWELPALVELSKQYKDCSFQIIGVYTGTPLEEFRYASKAEGIRELVDLFGIPYLLIENTPELNETTGGDRPYTMFVDRDGKVLRLNDEELYKKAAVAELEGDVDVLYFADKMDLEDPETLSQMSEETRREELEFVESYEKDEAAMKKSLLEQNPAPALHDSLPYQGEFAGSRSIEVWNAYIRYFLGMEAD